MLDLELILGCYASGNLSLLPRFVSTSTVNYVVTHGLRSWAAGVGCCKSTVLDPEKPHANVALLGMWTGTRGHR